MSKKRKGYCEIRTCKACGREYNFIIMQLPSNMDDKGFHVYSCPYCHEAYEEYLLGNEMIRTEKLKEKDN